MIAGDSVQPSKIRIDASAVPYEGKEWKKGEKPHAEGARNPESDPEVASRTKSARKNRSGAASNRTERNKIGGRAV
jgi:hypothetical protein